MIPEPFFRGVTPVGHSGSRGGLIESEHSVRGDDGHTARPQENISMVVVRDGIDKNLSLGDA